MAEQLTLTVADVISAYSVSSITFDWGMAFIRCAVKDQSGRITICTYEGQTATDLMIALNKVNLTTSSLQKRILTQLVTDGKLPAGTVTGTPD